MPDRFTPIDILNLKFRRQFRGYAREEVEEFLRRVAVDLEAALTECAAQKERMASHERELNQYHLLDSTMRDALVMAQKAADETRAAAHAHADAQIKEAQARIREMEARIQAHVAEMTTRIEELKQERLRLARELKGRLSTQLAWVNSELAPDTEPNQSGEWNSFLSTRGVDSPRFTIAPVKDSIPPGEEG